MKLKRVFLYTCMLVAVLLTCLLITGCDTNEYTVTLVGDDHVKLSTEKTTYRKGETVVVNKEVDPGYHCNTEYGNISFFDSFEMPGCDITVTATTYAKKYHIEYVGYGDEYTSYGSPTGEYTVEDEVSLPNAAKLGYSFVGWYTDKELTTPIKKIPKGSTGDMTLYPKFSIETYTMTYHLPDGVSNNPKNRTTYTVEEPEKIHFYSVEMEGREFLGWYTSEDLSGSNITGISPGCTGNIDLYPMFLSLDYTEDGYRILRSRADLERIFKDGYDTDGKYRLLADIKFKAGEDTPTIRGFEGIFDGNGHSITNLSAPLFSGVYEAKIENLTISASRTLTMEVSTDITRNVGCLIDKISQDESLTLTNVHLASADIKISIKDPLNFGGLIGNSESAASLYIEGCTVTNLNVDIFAAGSANIGGILGSGMSVLKNCSVTLDEDDKHSIELTKRSSHHKIGGLVGYAYESSIIDSYYEQKTGSVFEVYASEYCASVTIGGLVGFGNKVSIASSGSLIYKINFDSNADGLSGFTLYIAGLVGNTDVVTIKDAYVEASGYQFEYNTPFEKHGVTLKFYYGFFACGITESNIEGTFRSPKSIVNNGSTVSSAYIEDYFLISMQNNS